MSVQLIANQSEETLPEGHPNLTYRNDEGEELAYEMDKLATHITLQWQKNKDDRVYVEQEMMRAQEAVNNHYDPTTLAEIRAMGGSEIFVPLTSMQCNAASSWLLSIIQPPGDKGFSIKPSPIPEFPEAIKQEIKKKVEKTIAATAGQVPPGAPPDMAPPKDDVPVKPDGSPVTPTDVNAIAELEAEDQEKKFKKESKRRAEKMENLIHDQLQSSDWFSEFEDFITDLVTFPSAFIKTTYEYKTTMSTVVVDGKFTMEATEKLVEKDERVSPFDIYPSPDQKTIHDGSMIERLKLGRQEIYNCLDKPGYSNENIIKVLEETEGGGFPAWQSNVDSVRRYQENHATDFSGDDGNLYGLRFLGYVSIEELVDWGYSVETLQEQGFITQPLAEDGTIDPIDRLREIDIDAVLVGNHVIKAVPNMDPEGKRPYYMASYRKVPGSFWGKGVAQLARPHQRLVNATARALSNNMGIASGPQIVVYTDRLPNGESLQSIRPLKIWQMVSDPAGSNAQPLQFFQPNSNAKELMSVYQYFFDTVGDVTGIPKQAYSSDPSRTMPNAQTASGLAMLLETASKQIKQAVKNVDTGVMQPRLQYQFRTNMMNPEVPNSFKGDMQIIATGAKSVVAKAVENQRRIELLQATANPMDMAVLGEEGRSALLREIITSYDMTDVVPSAEEMEKKKAQAAQQPKPPSPEEVKLQIEQIKSQTRLEDQKLEMELAMQQQQTDLKIAQMELERKQIDAEIAMIQNQQNNETKLKEAALREKNANARFQYEATLKDEHGTGI